MAQLNSILSDDRAPDEQKVNEREGGTSRSAASMAVVTARAGDRDILALAHQLNGSLTALMLYMAEIKQRSDEIAHAPGEHRHVRMVVDNALMQTQRVCALVNQISGSRDGFGTSPRSLPSHDTGAGSGRALAGLPGRTNGSLTAREREVLKLISEGHSNKEGALRMNISPRTFESHRAGAMRKLGVRNTAELVRTALLNQIG